MKIIKSFGLVIAVIAIVIFFSSFYVVSEGQNGLLLRLGQIVTDNTGKGVVKLPGLHFKIPLITQARLFDVRLQTLTIEAARITTDEKRDVLVDYYVKWRIQNLPLYYTSTGGYNLRAETLLEQKLNDGLRAQFGRRKIADVVSEQRDSVMMILQKQANDSARELGISVIDVRIKRIDLPTKIGVFQRMEASRKRIANDLRSRGTATAEAIRAQADANVTVTIATAQSNAKRIRGEGDAIAGQIYAKAYDKNPEFFSFYRSMQAYQEVFRSKQDILVLKPDSQFFKYFNQANRK